ncbi:PREDICTED: uncharacterized protein LOC105365220 [Ceratosolen solmsi marchali]|uniref:Uncharacterized protein LOC105365220 n=1 Tax=Ceratosolen solmsi marchali TaxID=326594 RepID=A0AAJ7DZ12_9HYME|nr:PREDICTED: uncharacterized protein LOC105365220 [Ceratosolen solmsi marchali]
MITKINKRPYQRRHRSCEPNIKLKKNTSLPKFRRKTRPCSASSLKSVIYIGRYRKIPKLIVLDDYSDEEKSNMYKKKPSKNQTTSNDRPINTLHNENDLLSMLNEMHINTAVTNTVFD